VMPNVISTTPITAVTGMGIASVTQ
jgi:hypothetical protein